MLYGRRPMLLREVGAVAEKGRLWSDAEKLDAETRQFMADFTTAWNAWPAPLTGDRLSYTDRFTTFMAHWRTFFEAGAAERQSLSLKGAITFGAMLGAELANFERFERDFAGFVREFTDTLGEHTSASPPDGKSPLERALSLPRWVVPIGLAVAAVVLLGPAIGPVLGAMAAHKAATAAVAL